MFKISKQTPLKYSLFIQKNKNVVSILVLWLLMWFGLGTHLNETFNLKNYFTFPNFDFLRSNLIFYIYLVLLGYFLYYRNFSQYIFLLLYPTFSFIGYLNNSNEGFFFGFHYFVSFSSIVLFINLISSDKINKKLIFNVIHYSTILILSSFFIIFIFPDFIISIFNLTLSGRGEGLFEIYFSDIFYLHIPQNSNGASRIVLILSLLLMSYYSSLLKNKFSIRLTLILFLILTLATINMFFQSKFNILFYIIASLFIFLFDIKNVNKLKIFSLIVIISFPFVLHVKADKIIYDNEDTILPPPKNRIFSMQDTILSLSKNRIFSMREGGILIFKGKEKSFFLGQNQKEMQKEMQLDVYQKEIQLDVDQCINRNNSLIFGSCNHGQTAQLCRTHSSKIDGFLGGRVCGWEIAIINYFEYFKFFGYGFFEDQKILKQFQKLSSNSLVFALYNGGVGSLIVMIIFYLMVFTKLIKIFIKSKSILSIKCKFYFLLSFYLLARGILEDTLAFISVDSLLIVACISFFNYYLENSKNLFKRS